MNLGRRRIKNEELCAVFSKLGYEKSWAFLASGNVVFESQEHDAQYVATSLQAGLNRELQYDVPTFIRTEAELRVLATQTPFTPTELDNTGGKVQVAILSSIPTSDATAEAMSHSTEADQLRLIGRELFWLPRAGISTSDLNIKRVERAIGPMTVRTHRTIARLAAKLASGA